MTRRFRNKIRKHRLEQGRSRPLRIEQLDNRRMLAVLTVDTHLDNFNPIAPFTDGVITLREAVEAANTNAPAGDAPAGDPGADIIKFDPPLSGEAITLSGFGLLLTESVTIDASALSDGITIDANNQSRHFALDGANPTRREFTLRGLTLVNGRSTRGGAIFVDRGDLFLEDSTLTGNSATIIGGGIYVENGGTATIANSTLSGNAADDSGGGMHIRFGGTATVTGSTLSGNHLGLYGPGIAGGGISNYGTLTVDNSTLSANSGYLLGGGIHNSGTATITNSTVTENSAVDGGGISNDGMATITDSTLSTNSATNGGGVFFSGLSTTTITGSTVSGNSASFNGGGILTGSLTITNITSSTVFGNSATRGAGVFNRSRATIMTGSIVANSQGAEDLDVFDADSFFRGAYNLIGDGSRLSDFTDSIQGAPLLGPLADNGGPTMTHLPTFSAPVINAGDPAAMAGVGATPEFDQRGIGFSRVIDGQIDLGAVERQLADIGPDFNGDGFINGTDIDLLQANIVVGPADPDTFDLTGDGSVTIADRDEWLVQAGAANLASGNAYLLGDANLDGNVDGRDFLIWNDNKFTSTSDWSAADFSADGTVNGGDFVIWNSNKFLQSGTPSAVVATPFQPVGSFDSRESTRVRWRIPIEQLFERPLDEHLL